ncbi:MAG: type II toxin-antitoxin system death-on-curing family toxin [Verrucomicrobia bacterium]|nr:type II toxin-antitoxin system death-on-curing family toxin [Verrucomicrobiota bacterium]
MSEPLFLTVAQVEEFHREALAAYGGIAGVRDRGLLESAVFQPQYVHLYGRGDLCDVAAAYAYHIAQNQLFLDGNKRTALIAALTFLKANGHSAQVPRAAIYSALIAIAERRLDRDGLARLFRASEAGAD